MHLNRLKSALIVPVALASSHTMAQADSMAVEEVIVYAQKQAENLQKVPLALTAFTGDQIREDGIASLEDVGNRTPGLVFAAFSAGQPEIAIRGIGTKEDGAAAGDSTVVSVDDVYIAARTAQVFDIFDLERVEVLRGPQGTLYGKNSIGGSINFVTSRPTQELTARARLTAGDYGRVDYAGMISKALADSLYGKISFSRRSMDGYFDNIYADEDRGEIDTIAVRTQFLWMPIDDAEVTFTLEYADDDNGDTNREPVGSSGSNANGDSDDPVAVNEGSGGGDDPFDSLSDEKGFTKREVKGFAAKLEWELDDGTFTAISSWRESEFDWQEDSEGLPPPDAFAIIPATNMGFRRDITDSAIEDTEQLTLELRYAYDGSDVLRWVAGVFYSEEEIERTETFCIPNCGKDLVSLPYAPVASNFIVNASIQANDSTTWAAYGQGTYDLTDTLALTLGLRYSYEEKEFTSAGRNDLGIVAVGALIQQFSAVTETEDWSKVSGKIALNWECTDDILFYGSISTGFKSGGFTGSASTPEVATTPFEEETAINYELGMKSQLLKRSLQLNVASFFTDYTDLQVTRFDTFFGNSFGLFLTENAGEAEIYGVEAEMIWRLTQGLEVGGNYAFLDTEYTEFNGTPNNVGSGDFKGNELRQAPDNMLSAYARYTWDLADSSTIVAKVNYRYQDDSFYDPDNNDITVIPSYDLWDVQLSYKTADQNWEVAGWVKNVGDEEYRTHIYSQRGGQISFALFGPPRIFGMTATYTY
jgi:iron complex outermembrane recepter protein